MTNRWVRRLLRRHLRLVAAAAIAVLGLIVFVLIYFEPQDLVLNKTVNEDLPFRVGSASTPASGATAPSASASAGGSAQADALAKGDFRSGEHKTTGVAQLLRLPDGSHLVRLAPFRTSNGPALHVWLSAAPVGAGNGTVASAKHVDLGNLKGNIGDQNYAVPAGVQPSEFVSVVIWCQRFSVTFGSAQLE
jgi:electron transfer DM13